MGRIVRLNISLDNSHSLDDFPVDLYSGLTSGDTTNLVYANIVSTDIPLDLMFEDSDLNVSNDPNNPFAPHCYMRISSDGCYDEIIKLEVPKVDCEMCVDFQEIIPEPTPSPTTADLQCLCITFTHMSGGGPAYTGYYDDCDGIEREIIVLDTQTKRVCGSGLNISTSHDKLFYTVGEECDTDRKCPTDDPTQTPTPTPTSTETPTPTPTSTDEPTTSTPTPTSTETPTPTPTSTDEPTSCNEYSLYMTGEGETSSQWEWTECGGSVTTWTNVGANYRVVCSETTPTLNYGSGFDIPNGDCGNYTVTRCNDGQQFTVAKNTSCLTGTPPTYSVGDVIQFKQFSVTDGDCFDASFCGTITATDSDQPHDALVSRNATVDGCDDVLRCEN